MNAGQTNGWVARAQMLLMEYHLPSILKILRNPLSKYSKLYVLEREVQE
jgi:hypothetical protein